MGDEPASVAEEVDLLRQLLDEEGFVPKNLASVIVNPTLSNTAAASTSRYLLSTLSNPSDSLTSVLSSITSMTSAAASTTLQSSPRLRAATGSALAGVGVVDLGPPVSVDDFADYVREIRGPYERFVRDERARKEREAAGGANGDGEGRGGARDGDDAATVAYRAAMASIRADAESGDVADGVDQVPPMFFSADFDLSDRETFDTFVADPSPVLLQQRLTHYLDVVEVELLRQIGKRFDSFFSALEMFQALHRELETAVGLIHAIRADVKQAEGKLVADPLHVAALLRRKANMKRLYRKVKLMAEVRHSQHHLQLFLSQNDFSGALDLVDTTQGLLADQLPSIAAFKHLSGQLAEMSSVIERMMQADFVRFTIGWRSGDDRDARAQAQADAKEQLLPLMLGLIRSSKLGAVLQYYRERLHKEVTNTIKTATAEHMDALADGATEGNLAERLKALTWEDYRSVLAGVFSELLGLLEHMGHVHSLVGSVLENEAATVGEHESVALLADSSDILATTTELAHARCSKLLSLRAESMGRLTAAEFIAFHFAVDDFVDASEAVCGSSCHSLRSVLRTQAKAFVDAFHADRVAALRLMLESERWTQSKVPASMQAIVSRLTSTDDVVRAGAQARAAHVPFTVAGDEDGGGGGGEARVLVVGERSFRVVGSLLMVAKRLAEYVTLPAHLPGLAADVIPRVGEYLKQFNVMSCRLVMGAQALQIPSLNLKFISAKHLALTSQTLDALIALVPSVTAVLRELLPQTHRGLLDDLGRVEQDLQGHRNEIFNKLTAIMAERLTNSTQTLLETHWSTESDDASPYMASLIGDMTGLHRVLSSVLPAEQLELVFGQIVDAFDRKLKAVYSNVVMTQLAKGAILRDVACLMSAVGEMEGVTATVQPLWDFCEGQETISAAQQQAQQQQARRAAFSVVPDTGPPADDA